jgi:hypothetical protein
MGANRPKLRWLRHSILSINPPPRYINPTVFADMLLQKSPGSSTSVTYLATGGPETPEPTLQCWDHDCKGRKYSSRANLLRHKRTHGKKEKTCESCNKSFSRSEHLKYHRATSCKALHSDRQCYDHGCNGRDFSTPANLRREVEGGSSRVTARNSHITKQQRKDVRHPKA